MYLEGTRLYAKARGTFVVVKCLTVYKIDVAEEVGADLGLWNEMIW